ncbi:MAG: hypothetical protein GX493_08870, partial [Firmicutes bacterium]|nr:hypothetical protein [Bacillota bacterium]
MTETKDPGRIYRRALPCWLALTMLVAVVRVARPAGAELPRRGRFRTGLEALTVVRAMAERPQALGQVMLCLGIPTLARRAGEEDPLFRTDLDWVGLFWRLAAGLRYTTPQETFRAGLRVLGFRRLASLPRLVIRKEENRPARE